MSRMTSQILWKYQAFIIHISCQTLWEYQLNQVFIEHMIIQSLTNDEIKIIKTHIRLTQSNKNPQKKIDQIYN